jgi:hypothetical protein
MTETRPKWQPGDKVMLLVHKEKDWWVPDTVVDVKKLNGEWVVKLAGSGFCYSPSVVKELVRSEPRTI